MKLNVRFLLAGALASAAVLTAVTKTATATEAKITILYDAFGNDAAMKKDWGFSALVEVAGKRILFDTGNDGDIFAANIKAKGVDLTNLDFVILSHRHSDHMAGLNHVFDGEPKGEDLRSQRRVRHLRLVAAIELLPQGRIPPAGNRYYDGKPPEVMKFGTAWQGANFETIDKTTEVAPGVTTDRARVRGPRHQRAQGIVACRQHPGRGRALGRLLASGDRQDR
jgi:7,8-dihydropterin-6-yl-methyl-4-(beta-D-ribofuranosyl)aminobenzene 5'-phosphate synthase